MDSEQAAYGALGHHTAAPEVRRSADPLGEGGAGGGQTHQWAVLLDPRYYAPDALERIRETGEMPSPG